MAILQRPYAGQVKNLTPPAAGCDGWFLAVGGVICCGRWAAGLAGCGVGRCWRWAAGGGEGGQGVLAVERVGCGGIGAGRGWSGGCPVVGGPALGGWGRWAGASAAAAGCWWGHRPGRAVTDPHRSGRRSGAAGRQQGQRREDGQKKKARADGAACAAALAFGLHWRQWFRRGASRCRWWG